MVTVKVKHTGDEGPPLSPCHIRQVTRSICGGGVNAQESLLGGLWPRGSCEVTNKVNEPHGVEYCCRSTLYEYTACVCAVQHAVPCIRAAVL